MKPNSLTIDTVVLSVAGAGVGLTFGYVLRHAMRDRMVRDLIGNASDMASAMVEGFREDFGSKFGGNFNNSNPSKGSQPFDAEFGKSENGGKDVFNREHVGDISSSSSTDAT